MFPSEPNLSLLYPSLSNAIGASGAFRRSTQDLAFLSFTSRLSPRRKGESEKEREERKIGKEEMEENGRNGREREQPSLVPSGTMGLLYGKEG